MNLSPPILSVVAIVALVGALAAWWHSQRRLAQLRHRLARTEAARVALEQHAASIDARLRAMSKALNAQQLALEEAERAAQRAALEESLDAAAAPVCNGWADTQPAEGFDRTRPSTLTQ